MSDEQHIDESTDEIGQGQPVCPGCFEPVDPLAYYCPKCGEASGQLTPYIPFVNIKYNYSIFLRPLNKSWKRSWPITAVILIFAILIGLPIILIGLPFVIWEKWICPKEETEPTPEENTDGQQ